MTERRCGSRVLPIHDAASTRQSRPTMSPPCAVSRCFVRPANFVCPPRRSPLYLTDVIAGEVLAKIYRVSRANVLPSREIRESLHSRLSQWSLDLPEYLDYKVPSNRPCPAPQVLAMHIQYWATVLLLHRPLYVLCFSWLLIPAHCVGL